MGKLKALFQNQPGWILFAFYFGIFNDLVTTCGFFLQIKNATKAIMLRTIPPEIQEAVNPSDLQKINNIVLLASLAIVIIFITWDLFAYVGILRRKNWARKFIMSIALCGIFLVGNGFYGEAKEFFDQGPFFTWFGYLSIPFYVWLFVMLWIKKPLFVLSPATPPTPSKT